MCLPATQRVGFYSKYCTLIYILDSFLLTVHHLFTSIVLAGLHLTCLPHVHINESVKIGFVCAFCGSNTSRPP